MQISASGIIPASELARRGCVRRGRRHPDHPHRHLLANQIRLFGMTNHPPTGYPSSLRLLNKFKKTYPLEQFVPHEFPVDQVDKAMAQAFDIDACMKVVLTTSGG
jgi:threonine dehydrogenase-like Zn-dependent dehydrogenase